MATTASSVVLPNGRRRGHPVKQPTGGAQRNAAAAAAAAAHQHHDSPRVRFSARQAFQFAAGFVFSVALANSVMYYQTGKGLVMAGVELPVAPSFSVEGMGHLPTMEDIKSLSLASFVQVSADLDGRKTEEALEEAVAPKVIGSQVDMDEALEKAKQRIAQEKENAERRKTQGKEEEERRQREAEEEERRHREAEEEAEKRKEEEELAAAKAAAEKEEDEEKKDKVGDPEPGEESLPPADEEGEKKPGRPNESAEIKEDRMLRFFEEEKAAALAWPTAEDLAREFTTEKMESGRLVPVKPAQNVVRDPIPADPRPPLHRPRDEVQIEKMVVFISSTDRGQRINHDWSHGDKLDTIEVTLASLVSLCERGFDVTAWFVAAWKISDEDERIQQALHCARTGKPLEVRYWDHYSQDIGGHLSSKHRLAIKEAKDEFDFFVSIEDDIHFRPIMFDAFVDASSRLAGADKDYPEKFFPGFARKEHDPWTPEHSWAVWETDAEDYEAMYLGEKAGWFALVGGNRHQAMWMGTREQVHHLDGRCNSGWFTIDEEQAVWVEWWSGALQLWYVRVRSHSFVDIPFLILLLLPLPVSTKPIASIQRLSPLQLVPKAYPFSSSSSSAHPPTHPTSQTGPTATALRRSCLSPPSTTCAPGT